MTEQITTGRITEKYGYKIGQVVVVRIDIVDENNKLVKVGTRLRLTFIAPKTVRHSKEVIDKMPRLVDRHPYFWGAVRESHSEDKGIVRGHFVTIRPLVLKGNGCMNGERNEILGLGRVDKTVARRMYTEGQPVWMQPCKVNAHSTTFPPTQFSLGVDDDPFDLILRRYEHYNCNSYVTGTYAKFFVKEED